MGAMSMHGLAQHSPVWPQGPSLVQSPMVIHVSRNTEGRCPRCVSVGLPSRSAWGGCGGQGGRGSIHINQPPLTTTPLPWGLPQVPLLDFITGIVTVHVPQWPSGLYTQSPQPPAPLEKDRAQASAQSHLSAPLEGRGIDTGTPHSHVHDATLGPGLHARGRVSVGTGAIVLGLAWV